MARVLLMMLCAASMTAMDVAQRPKAGGAATNPRPAVPSTTAAGKDPYAAEPVVVEHLATVYRYNVDGTGSELDTAAVRIQSPEALRSFGVLRIPYRAGSRRVEFVSVRVRKPDGTAINTPVTDAQDQTTPLAQAAPQFSDLHVALLPVRGLAVGDRLESQIRVVFAAPEAKGAFWGTESFGQGRVVLERTVELRVPAGTAVQVSSPRSPAKQSEEAGETVYRWAGAQTRPTVAAENGEAAAGDEAEIGPAIAWTTFRSWADLGAWYRELMAPSLTVTPEVKAKADGVVFGLKTPRERIDALYGYVSHEVRSIDVPLGQGPWPPHAAGEVLSNQIGDGKDKSMLLATMLRAEGLPASLALVPKGDGAEPAVAVPSAFQEVLVVSNDAARGDVWLDTIPEVAAAGVLQQALRDRRALVIPATGDAALRMTPAELPFAAETRFEAKGELSVDGLLKAHVDLRFRGDEELSVRQALHTGGEAQWDRVAQSLLQSQGMHGEVSDTVATAVENGAVPLYMSFDLSVARYGDWENFRIAPLEPGLNLPFADMKVSPGREIRLGGKRTETAMSRLELPAGFGADLPAAVHVHTAFADLDKTYKLENIGGTATLTSERTLVVKQDRLSASGWPEYRGFLDRVGESEPWVQLTSAGGRGSHRPPVAGEDNPRAAELVGEAGQALERRDWAAAVAKLDEARALNPRQPFLWSSYGAAARGTGKLEEAIEDERRELKEHPEEAGVSHRLAADLVSAGKRAEALAVLQAALALNPRDGRTVLLLGDLEARSDAMAAEKTLRAGLATAPDSLEMKLALGRVLVREGKRAEGGALLTAVASSSEEPGELNDAAFALADAGLNLRVAELASRRCVQMLNTVSARAEVRGQTDAELRQTLAVIASWDTYGWVLLKEGMTSEAEPWLRAAWMDGYGAEPGHHLALLLQKQGNGAEAAQVLRLAGPVEAGDRAEGSAARTGEAGKPAGSDPEGSSRAERTFSVPRPGGSPAGTALFQMEYAVGGSGARLLTGDRALAGVEGSLARLNTRTQIPTGSPAHIFRQGVLRCGAAGSCTLEILPARRALTE